MTAYTAATYWLLGCCWMVYAFAITALSARPWRWVELAVAYLVVGYFNESWRDT